MTSQSVQNCLGCCKTLHLRKQAIFETVVYFLIFFFMLQALIKLEQALKIFEKNENAILHGFRSKCGKSIAKCIVFQNWFFWAQFFSESEKTLKKRIHNHSDPLVCFITLPICPFDQGSLSRFLLRIQQKTWFFKIFYKWRWLLRAFRIV